MSATIATYDAHAPALAASYESVSTKQVHPDFAVYAPTGQGLIALDIGARSGRDAAWLARRGYDMVAVEP